MPTADLRATWGYRINERGYRLGGYSGVIRVREARKGRWAWREKYRCEHIHTTRPEAVACAMEVRSVVG